jgi:hypothetical protein
MPGSRSICILPCARFGGWAPLFQEHMGMPMREEIYIPEGQPLGLPRTSAKARPRLLDDPDYNVMSAVIGIALLVAYYLALNCPLPDDMSAIFAMI